MGEKIKVGGGGDKSERNGSNNGSWLNVVGWEQPPLNPDIFT